MPQVVVRVRPLSERETKLGEPPEVPSSRWPAQLPALACVHALHMQAHHRAVISPGRISQGCRCCCVQHTCQRLHARAGHLSSRRPAAEG